jgi:ATP-dependent RNA helicase DDX3X
MLDNIKLCKYTSPTAIQCYCIPAILTNRDIIAVAQTGNSPTYSIKLNASGLTYSEGSGKTAAFLIPVLSKLMGKAKKLCGPRATVFGPDFDLRIHGVRAEPLVLIIAPTRELACQIFDETRRLCYRSMLRPCVAYGGAPTREQIVELQRGCDILIATPGRLIDFMENKGHVLSLQRVK